MKTMNVKLTRQWSGFEAGDVVKVLYAKGESMIRKGYGEQDKSREASKIARDEKLGPPRRRPVVETAMAEPVAEQAVVTPRPSPKPSRESAGAEQVKNAEEEKGKGD